jgi:hypothetical protein
VRLDLSVENVDVKSVEGGGDINFISSLPADMADPVLVTILCLSFTKIRKGPAAVYILAVEMGKGYLGEKSRNILKSLHREIAV